MPHSWEDKEDSKKCVQLMEHDNSTNNRHFPKWEVVTCSIRHLEAFETVKIVTSSLLVTLRDTPDTTALASPIEC